MLKKGLFVVFEGIDGVGKTSVINAIEKKLKATFADLKFVVTSELAGTQLGRALSKLMLDRSGTTPLARAYLFAAARAQNVARVIVPSLAKKWLVIGDRYLDSSVVYQGFLENLGIEKVLEINKIAIQNVLPDFVFVLNASVEKTRANLKIRASEDKFEAISFETKQQILNYYKKLSEKDPRYLLIDANGDLSQTTSNVWEQLSKIIQQHC